MAAKTTKKKKIAGKVAKTAKKKKSTAKKKTVAKKKAVSTKSTASKKKSAKAKRKVSKKPRAKKKKAAVSKLSKAEKAARRRKLNAYRRLLEKKRESLLEAYILSKSNTRIESRDGTEDYIDYAVSSYHRDFTLSLTELDRQQLKLVEEALIRLRKKEYGNCLHCTTEIPEKRLDVEPWARHCLPCQELDEQGLLEPPDLEAEPEEEEEILEGEAGDQVAGEAPEDPDDAGGEEEHKDDINH